MNFKNHIAFLFKATAFALAITVLMPYAIKLAHYIHHTEHKVCNQKSSTHIHEIDFDCEFYKFNFNTLKFKTQTDYTITISVEVLKPLSVYTYLVYNHKQLTANLRAPPIFTV